MININQKFGLEGYYSFKVTNSITGKERDVSHIIAKDHKNLVLDSGLNAIGTTGVVTGCKVGTGSSPVVATQTDLDTTVAGTTTVQASSYGRLTTPPYYTWGRRTFRFAQGVAAGNLTEVGVYTDSSGNSLFSRALIVDGSGNPTTLTILSDEWLDVTYELRVYQDLNDKTFNINLLGTDHVVTVRPANVTSNTITNISSFFSHILYYYGSNDFTHYNGEINTIVNQPSGTTYNSTFSASSYVGGSYERTVIMSAGLNDANFTGGIKASVIRTEKAIWQLGYSPAIDKDNFKTLVLNVTISWGRYDPES